MCLFLAACGGGGGESGGSPSANPTPIPAPSPAPAPAPSGGNPSPGVTPTGRLWHDNFALDSTRGFQMSPLNGERTRLLDPADTAVPTPDGLHYVVYTYDTSTRVSTVIIRASNTGAEFARATFNGYVHRIRPSPVRLGDLLVTWDDCAGCVTAAQGEFSFVDLPGRRRVASFSRVNSAADWLPDGRYVHVDAAGRVHVGTPAGARTEVGRLTVAGRTVQSVWVDPTGSQMMARWERRTGQGDLQATDLWISAIDGSNLQQLTATDRTTYGLWSPDGLLFGFDRDSAITCNTPGCAGTPVGGCDLYSAPTTARNITTSSPQVRRLTVVDQSGRNEVLGCDLLGWTR